MIRLSRQAFFMVVILAFWAGAPSAAFGETVGKLIIDISGFPSSDGFAMVALTDSKESYESGEDAAIAMTKVKLADQAIQVVFTNLPYGWYGISIYHDENGNGLLDENPMGIPKEAYGFSNNARGFFGKPGFEDVKFELKSSQKQIVIAVD